MIRVKSVPLAAITLFTLLAGVFGAKLLGVWNTESTKQPARYATGELAGLPNPADIRGSYTWVDIENAFGIPAAEAAAAFSTPSKGFAPTEKVNALETAYADITLPEGTEIGTDSVRLFVALYLGQPYLPEDGTLLPDEAIAILRTRPGVDTAALDRYAMPAVPAAPAPAATTPAPATTEHVSPVGSITGKTTFGDLYDWGLTEADVETAIGFAPGPRTQSVRDAATAAGVEFSTMKAALQALLDSASP